MNELFLNKKIIISIHFFFNINNIKLNLGNLIQIQLYNNITILFS